ncbi:CarboxypepD_reg-like domain-containing protein [Aquiflexum balticum DSM 16537]|uniref:CarboxypepD_reg-like domain-containing protein n=1 Tax=Aquiflexum balticum DSM 16537 TaxID=758820 RepID=A0A1W2H9N9_9BACT|nr:outer membrane beta-barrel protein [Aquiflexum balticum]SMD45432.1 CarboxypepD_reg-like domain-containing protein [Aquiflexum balticum DSM 16537]
MKYLFFFLFFVGITTHSLAQTYSIRGNVLEEGKKEILPFVNIILLSPIDSSQVIGTVSDGNGQFEFTKISEGDYILKIQYLGFQNFFRTIEIRSDIDLGNIYIQEEATDLSEVIVEARRSTGTQKGDTTMFNADAFKTMKDASAQTLLEKLPGVNSENGILQAQGENIAQILVDGKPYFGTDVRTALQNLPAEVIQSIEIFDQKSEKSQLSGFDDGERLKTINIITKPNRRKGQFGKATAGYGTDERYLAGTSVNIFDEDQRITITGLSNNINIQNYSSDPNIQSEGNQQEGIITTNILGLNYSDLWGEKIKITGSYLYTKKKNVGIVDRFRDFVTTDESNKFYNETSRDVRVNNQHQADLRLEYNPNEKNRFLYIPRFSARFETENSGFFGQTDDGINPINAVENIKNGYYQDYDLFNRFFYSHKFNKPGRTISARTIFAKGWNNDESDRKAVNTFYDEAGTREEILDQRTTRERYGNRWSTNVSYTEPIGQKGQMEIEYEIGNRANDSEQLIFNVEDGDFDNGNLALDTTLSNSFVSKYLTQEFELGYQFLTEKYKIQAELEYQDARLNNNQKFPNPEQLNRVFQNFLPTVRMEYKFSDNTNIQLDYDTYTNEPQISQLQAVINNTNPLQLRTGNPALDQSYTNQLRLRFRSNNPDTENNWFLFAQTRLVDNFISNSTLIASEPTEIQDGIILETGSQLNKPVNLDGFKEFRSWLSYGLPLGFIKSNFNINAGAGYTQRPGQVNDQIGFNNSTRLSTGFSLNSSISDQLDFNIWSRSSFNDVKNTLNPNLNDDFFQQRFRVNFNWIIWEGIIYRLDLNHQINAGLSEGFDTNFSLVNMSIGKKMFNNQRGEISLMVYDLLGQNANVRRNITETFIEDVQTNVLQRYVMLSFTYNLRRFSKGMDEKDYSEMYSVD